MLKLIRNMGVARRARATTARVRIDAARADVARGAVRAGQDHARLGAGARARCWRASARPRCRCRAAAPSARGRSTSTSRACRRWAPRSCVEHGYMVASCARAARACKGARITTDMVTVTGTENFLMAAALAEGETVLENAAQEPEIADLAEMLIAMGAKIEGHGTSRIRIQGVEQAARLHAPGRGRPHRGRHLPVRGGRDRRRRGAAHGRARPPRGGDREAARSRRHGRGRSTAASACSAEGRLEGAELPHHRIPGLPDRHAGAVHGAQRASPRARRPSPRPSSRTASCTSTSWCAWARSIQIDGKVAVIEGVRAAVGRHRDGDRPARLGQPGDRRPGGRRRDAGRPHLPPRPRLRPHGSQAARPRRRHRTRRAGEVQP